MDEYMLIIESPVYGWSHYSVKGEHLEDVLNEASKVAYRYCCCDGKGRPLLGEESTAVVFKPTDKGTITVIGLGKTEITELGRMTRETGSVPMFDPYATFDPYNTDKYNDDARSDLIAEDRAEREDCE